MIAQLLQAAFVHDRTMDLVTLLEEHAAHPEKAPAGQEVAAEDLRAAMEILRGSLENPAFSGGEGSENTWMPCDPYLAIVQSALEECYRKAGAVASVDTRGLEPADLPDVTEETLKPQWIHAHQGRGFLREMEQSDWLGWGLSYAVASAIKTVKGRHPFWARPDGDPPLKLSKRSRLVLAADWGSGVARARAVGRSMGKRLREQAPVEDRHMIHLGDVYYAGRGFEYNDRFRQHWPVTDGEAETIGSWNLNANHDMFTGGHGYFGCLDTDTRFARQKGFSYFALESEDWLIAGLDTAWEADGIKGDAGGLAMPQLDWLMRLRKSAPGKRLMLMSHHQPFSLYENDSPLLQRRIEPLLSAGGGVDAWFWGHEHRCAVYEPSHRIQFPVLMGHGGVPVHASKKPQPAGVRYEYRNKRAGGLLETFAMMGFVVVDLDGPKATVRFINEENIEHQTFAEI